MSARTNRLQRRLEDKDFKLSALLNIAQAINAAEDTEALLEQYREVLCDALDIGKLALYSFDTSWTCILQYGIEGDVAAVEDASFFDAEHVGLNVSGASGEVAFDVVIPVMQDDQALAYLLVGDLDEANIGVSPVIKHMNFIQTITNIIIVAVRNRRLVEDNIRQERMSKELELAAEMQSMLVPSSLPDTPIYQFAAHYRPHEQVGGDYYDVLELGGNQVMMCIADVSGKGVSAAFLMANFQASLHSIFSYETLELERIIHELNERVLKSALGEKYITFFVGIFNTETRLLDYVNCGHNPPVLVHANGVSEELKLGSIGLGMFDEIPTIDRGQVKVEPGSFLLCYTDGLTEVENSEMEEFGSNRVEQTIQAHRHDRAEVVVESIMEALTEFKGDSPYVDDTALLGCRFL